MGVDGHPPGQFAAAVHAVHIRRPDLDPGGDSRGEVPHDYRRFLGRGNAAFAEGNSLLVFEAVGQYPSQHVFGGLGRVARDPQIQIYVDAAIDVGQLDGEGVQCCAQGHGAAA